MLLETVTTGGSAGRLPLPLRPPPRGVGAAPARHRPAPPPPPPPLPAARGGSAHAAGRREGGVCSLTLCGAGRSLREGLPASAFLPPRRGSREWERPAAAEGPVLPAAAGEGGLRRPP